MGINPQLPRAPRAPPKYSAYLCGTTLKDPEASEPLGASVWHNRVLRWTDIYLISSAAQRVCVAFNGLPCERQLSRYRAAEISREQGRVTNRFPIGLEELL